ncbi:phosphoesterase [bacterium]|nr:MAG: phosphoesterase [bacterium]
MFATLALLALGQQVGKDFTPTGQTLRPYGTVTPLKARPVAMVGGSNLFIKDEVGVRRVSMNNSISFQKVDLPGGTSMTGLITRDRSMEESGYVWATDAASGLHEIAPDTMKIVRTIQLPKPKVGGQAYGCGIAQTSDRIYVCGNRGNELIEVDPKPGTVTRRLDLPPAPYEVTNFGPDRLAVSCWGRRPGKRSAPSSGTEVDVDERGIGTGGTLAIVDLKSWRVEREIPVGAMPTALQSLPGGRMAVACANADTLEVLLPDGQMRRTVLRVNPDDAFGSAPNGLCFEKWPYGEERLYVTLGGANALAVFDVAKNREELLGLIPTGWYPGPIAVFGGIHVGNVKGRAGTRGVYEFEGTLQTIPRPTDAGLRGLTAIVKKLAYAPREIPVKRNVTPKPVPVKTGDPSPIQHVVYVIKENRTYDQLLGDMKEGDGDPNLCIFGERITPNLHALARRYVLLDNYYCNGVNSADGHAWSIEGNASAYFERTFGGWTRSYPFGDDPLATTATGYLWDHVLGGSRSFRNHGEYDYAELSNPKATYAGLLAGRDRKFTQKIGVKRLRRYSSDVPGWNMGIPDQVRADRFIADLRNAEQKGSYPNLSILYLPQDHTNGTAPGKPSPRAFVADNDLALGRAIEALSKSKFWSKMAVFVIEDDPQAGFDHVDGHRSICLVVSPYTRGRGKVSKFYNQTSVSRTMLRILGLPPRTRFEAGSPLMTDTFRSKADRTPYRALTPQVSLSEVNPPASSLKSPERRDAMASARLPLDKPDQIEDDQLNRILWRNRRPGETYPARFAGAHGRGLRKKGLSIDRDDDD